MDRLTCKNCPFRGAEVDLSTGNMAARCEVDQLAIMPITPPMPLAEMEAALEIIECHRPDLGEVIRRATRMIGWYNWTIEAAFNSQTHRQAAAIEAAKPPVSVPAAAR